ncbi:MAG: S41 family peptidase [Ignavibacteria bacterium]|nr:S41 family peptidase [Ignavibacteria bacterium]
MLKKRYIILSTCFILSILTIGAFRYSDKFFEVARGIDLFTRIYKEVAFSYVDEINPGEFMRAGIRGMLSTVDPYTVFIDEKKQDDIDLLTNGKYGGIGVSIGMRDGKVILLEIMEGYSAQKQGLQIGDIILKVDNKEFNEKNFEAISASVKGEPGTFVKLQVLREGLKDTLKYELLREEIHVKNVSFAGFVPENSTVAYIKLNQFSRAAGEEVKNALHTLNAQRKLTGIIFDIRNNPGGLLDVSVDICNRFLPKNSLIVSTKGREESSLKQYYATQEPLYKDIPLVLLVNDNSASASEILAGAMQDHDRAVILGEKTFGKGLVQTITPLSYNTSLKITTAKYYTPSGRCIQKINYSKDNKVIATPDSLKMTAFFTDHKRKVFSSGGITPDTVVVDPDLPGVVRDLLAKGMFFKYTSSIIAKNGKEDVNRMSEHALFEEFQKFIASQNYEYRDELEKKVSDLIEFTKKDKQYSQLTQKFVDLESSIKKSTAHAINNARTEILQEITAEVCSRSEGTEGRIKKYLQSDVQFQTAVELIKNSVKYKSLLAGK